MCSLGIRELKNELSHYLRHARQRGRLIVTERGKPIAIMQSLDDAQASPTPELELARLAKEGAVRLRQGHRVKKIPLVEISVRSVSSTITQDRRRSMSIPALW